MRDLGLAIGSLCSGIGGLELGLEWARIGRTVWQVEQGAFCRRKLAWRWPDATRFEKVENVGAANLAPVDLICFGFSCQDISSAGTRTGLTGPRSSVWFECARVVAELRPRWVVVENVRSNASAWVDTVRGTLEREGYASLPIPIAASDCGAPHQRARVFIVACAPADGHNGEQQREQRGPSQQEAPGAFEAAPDAYDHARHVHAKSWDHLRDAERHGGWSAEPPLARVVSRFPGRVDYERALGNSVVPQCGEVVGHVIRQLIGVQEQREPTGGAGAPDSEVRHA